MATHGTAVAPAAAGSHSLSQEPAPALKPLTYVRTSNDTSVAHSGETTAARTKWSSMGDSFAHAAARSTGKKELYLLAVASPQHAAKSAAEKTSRAGALEPSSGGKATKELGKSLLAEGAKQAQISNSSTTTLMLVLLLSHCAKHADGLHNQSRDDTR
jgi:hypothetical protein